LRVARAAFLAAFAVIAFRLVDLSVLQRGDEARLAERGSGVALPVGRGDIVDRNGVLLATSLDTASLYADPRKVLDPQRAAARLAGVLPNLDVAALAKQLAGERSFVWVRRNLTPREKYRVNALGIPGLDFLREEKRVYPHGHLLAHVLGFTDIDGRGIAGVEKSFDDVLRDQQEPLVLSVDLRLQHLLYEELSRAVDTFQAVGGAGVILDARTAEVMALVSLPDFDPNALDALTPEARFNRATLGVYEMGSTFKLFTAAMALDTGTVSIDSGYDATKPLRVSRFTIRDYHPQRRWLSVPEIILYSSNIGAAKMGRDVGPARQEAFLDSIGMLRALPLELPEVGTPMVPHPWREINAMTIAFGHGLATTPLHLVNGVAALINGGVLRAPTLLKREGEAGAIVGDQVISPQTSELMRQLMHMVVERGTGRKAQVDGYAIGGKTGTAEKNQNGKYQRRALLSSFVGAFPIDAPRYVVLTMLDEPKGNKATHGYATGGWVAAPTVGNVIRRMAPLVGLKPMEDDRLQPRNDLLVKVSHGKRGASY
jgi:cell division protein FtsI (penicillin-binding protein 3)